MAEILEFMSAVQLSAGVPVVVLLAALMHWSDVLSSLPSAVVSMLSVSSQNLVFGFCLRPSLSRFHIHIVSLSTLMLTEVYCFTLTS